MLSNNSLTEVTVKCPAGEHIPLLCALLLVEVRKIHRLVDNKYK